MNQPTTEKVNAQMDIKQTEPVECDKCKNQSFQEAIMLRKVSAILSPSGKSGLLPIPIFVCNSCGHTNQSFLPPELRANPIVKASIISQT
jgi:hypothetical protein